MGDFLAIVKEKNFIEVVSRSINQVDMLVNSLRKYNTVQGDYHHGGRPQGRKSQPRECDRQPRKRREHGLAKSCSRKAQTNITTPSYKVLQINQTYRESLDLSGGIPSSESYSFVGLLKRLKHRFKTPSHFRGNLTLLIKFSNRRGLLKETRLPMEEYFPSGLT